MFVEAAFLLAAAASAPPPDGAALARACAGRDGWSDAAPPARIHGNAWYVGTCGIAVVLVTGPQGHVLIDGATEQAAPGIAANIERLGFRLRDVKWIVTSHEHVDHVGGVAALQRMTGAKLAVRAPAVPALTSGTTDADDPQAGILDPFPPARIDRRVRDGEVVRVGPLRLTAVATPGHTSGGTSWTWRSCTNGACTRLAYVDSMTPVSRDDYRFTDHPARVAPFRRTFARVRALPCDLLITPHPSASNLFERLSGAAPLIAPGQCRAYAAGAAQRLDKRLADERSAGRR